MPKSKSPNPDFRALRVAAETYAETSNCAMNRIISLLRDLTDPVAAACLDEYDPRLTNRVRHTLAALEAK